MERKIGEIFKYKGKTLKVVESTSKACDNCHFFDGFCKKEEECGSCLRRKRTDNKPVIFVEVKDEQPQEQEEQPQKLNLCEVLKYCPKREMFWSPMFGNVWFYNIDQYTKRVKVMTSGVASWYINADGTITIDKVTSPEIMLYPSRKQRDWSKFTAPWYKKERFDQKTLKAFDMVLVNHDDIWKVDFFSHICQYEPNGWCQCIGDSYYICIPYNDETKHLVGTKDEAPEFYKYWED